MKFNATLVLQGLLCAFLFLFGNAPDVAAQDWKPTRPIRLVVPYPPGGGADIIGRLVAQAVAGRLEHPIVVENRGGANGSIGSDYVYRADPDGHVILLATVDSQAMYPQVAKVTFDSSRYVPLGGIAQMGYVLMGRADLPPTLPELLQLMKTRTLTYASAGHGGSPHVLTVLFGKQAGRDLLHVPFQGSGPAILAVLGGSVDLTMVPLAVAPQYRGKLRAYGVTSPERVDSMKEVPTFAEQGLAVTGGSWMAWVAPPGTPEPVAATLSRALSDAVASPAVNTRLREMGMAPITLSRPEFEKLYLDEYRKWGAIIRDANIKVE
ncbi:MAG: Bug family tripartite tricarboxylate transporter substrate binding protein [Lautropia sp.]